MTATEAARLEAWARRLETHPAVAAAQPVPGAGLLIDVVPDAAANDTVDGWQYLFEDLYDSGEDRAGSRDPQLVGWIDGLSGEAVPAEQMREWADAAVSRIQVLRPRRVLEIGAGTGLVLSGLLARADPDEYVATDLASASVAMLRSIGERAEGATRVRVHQGPAHAELPLSQAGGYDTVILNSVVQYFPSTGYLEAVIAAAITLTAPGGHLFLGDLRDATLLEPYYRRRAGRPEADLDLEHHQRRDHELSLTPDYVRSLERVFDAVTAVETAPKRGRHDNEMTVFRFDAVLHLGCAPPALPRVQARATDLPVDEIARHIASGGDATVWRGLPNARLEGSRSQPGAVDPEPVWALDGCNGWKVRVGCASGTGSAELEVWAEPPGAPGGHFALALPGLVEPSAPGQAPLPPARMWSLQDALKDYLRSADGTATPGDGVLPAIRLSPGRLRPTGKENTRT